MDKKEFLKEIYFDFCLKHDLPKDHHNYMSVDLYLIKSKRFNLTKNQISWLNNFRELQEIIENENIKNMKF
tara:strand:- start:828 stop:1040 length:213 start_codon:yes stop_codon:yes gene_type:complete